MFGDPQRSVAVEDLAVTVIDFADQDEGHEASTQSPAKFGLPAHGLPGREGLAERTPSIPRAAVHGRYGTEGCMDAPSGSTQVAEDSQVRFFPSSCQP